MKTNEHGWIAMTDRMPGIEDGPLVLVYGNNLSSPSIWSIEHLAGDYKILDDFATHWMRIPPLDGPVSRSGIERTGTG